jgi:hypothetical protein
MKEKILLEQIAKAKLLIENYRLINQEMEETVVEMINEKIALQELVDILLEVIGKIKVTDLFTEKLSDRAIKVLANIQIKQRYIEEIKTNLEELS